MVLMIQGVCIWLQSLRAGVVSQTRTRPVVCVEERGHWVCMYVACEEGDGQHRPP